MCVYMTLKEKTVRRHEKCKQIVIKSPIYFLGFRKCVKTCPLILKQTVAYSLEPHWNKILLEGLLFFHFYGVIQAAPHEDDSPVLPVLPWPRLLPPSPPLCFPSWLWHSGSALLPLGAFCAGSAPSAPWTAVTQPWHPKGNGAAVIQGRTSAHLLVADLFCFFPSCF